MSDTMRQVEHWYSKGIFAHHMIVSMRMYFNFRLITYDSAASPRI